MLRNTMFRLSLMLAILYLATSCFRRIDSETNLDTPFTQINEEQINDLMLGLTIEQKIGQLIIGKSSIHYDWDDKILSEWLSEGKVGGLMLQNLELETYLDFISEAKGLPAVPAFYATDQKVSLHNQFSDLPKFPTPATISSIDSSEIQKTLSEHYIKQCKGLGINLSFSPSLFQNFDPKDGYDFQCFETHPIESMARTIRHLNSLKSNRILTVGDAFSDYYHFDSEVDSDSLLSKYQALTSAGISGLMIGENIFKIDTFGKLPPNFLAEFFNKQLNYNGLIISNLSKSTSHEKSFHAGSDIYVTSDVSATFNFLSEMVESGRLSQPVLNEKVRKVLSAKSWMNGGEMNINYDKIKRTVSNNNTGTARLTSQNAVGYGSKKRIKKVVSEYFHDPVWPHFIRMIQEQSVILANNPKNTIPYLDMYAKDFRIIQFSEGHLETFKNTFSKYTQYSSSLYRPNQNDIFSNFDLNKFRHSLPVFVLNDIDLQNTDNQYLIEAINKLSRKTHAVLVNFGDPYNLQFFDSTMTTIQVFEKNEITEAFAARMLFGGASSSGKLPTEISKNYPFGKGLKTNIIRLEYSEPEDVGIAEKYLYGIDTLAEWAISDTMTPGCQILIAKDGHVIYSKAFGKHNYSGNQKVKTSDLYDIASVTKVAATTLAAMKMTDDEKLILDNEIQNYLSNIDSPEVRTITVKELLTHQSGLQANMPIGDYIWKSRRNRPDCNTVFCTQKQNHFQIPVTKNLYFSDLHKKNIWKRVFQLEVGDKGKYIYSDVNFNILQKIIEENEKTVLDEYMFQNFFKPLGMERVGYLPLRTFKKHEIVPTEEDEKWRNELLRGYPHDQTAALFGGVAGNAGMFANAEDLAVLFQMLLEEGLYGDVQYLKPETVKLFTSSTENHQRGLGFNKPGLLTTSGCSKYASGATFGHSGFTGTCVWVDPNHDLIYIFLSNRIHPDASNRKLIREGIRRKIHDVVYESLNTFDSELPDLDLVSVKG